MNKFIETAPTKTTKTKQKAKEIAQGVEVLTVGAKKFLICPQCGWKHVFEEEKCRFCGKTLRG